MNQILPQFQKYLAELKLAPENQIPFFAGWASRFIRFSNGRHDSPSDLKIQLFLKELNRGDIKEKGASPKQANSLIYLVRPGRFELPTSRFVVWRSIQLSHGRIFSNDERAL